MPSHRNTVIEHPGEKGGAHLAGDADKRQSEHTRQAEEERQAEPISKPGGFKNDPDDPTNPNEVRERHLRKLRR
jgi:hypothetical protein